MRVRAEESVEPVEEEGRAELGQQHQDYDGEIHHVRLKKRAKCLIAFSMENNFKRNVHSTFLKF